MKRPLDGLRVLELGGTEAAGVAGLLLADHGAEVIRVEGPAPEGPETVPDNSDAITFGLTASGDRLCDRGKKRIFLDLRKPEQLAVLKKLALTCDAVLDGFAPGIAESLGLDGKALRVEAPHLIYTSVSGYGSSGPCADRLWNDASVQAESGFMSTTGPESGETYRSGGDMASFLGGAMACIGTLIGLLEQQKKDAPQGRQLDVSMMDSILYGLENQFSLYLKSGVVPRPRGNSYALSAPVGNFPCGDGKQIMISVATEAQWQAFAEALHREDWLERPEFINVSRRIENYKLLGREVTEVFSRYTRDQLMQALQSRHCIYGCINDFPAVAEHRQVRARRMFMDVESPDGMRFAAPADPIVTDGVRMQERRIHARGEDTAQVLQSLD